VTARFVFVHATLLAAFVVGCGSTRELGSLRTGDPARDVLASGDAAPTPSVAMGAPPIQTAKPTDAGTAHDAHVADADATVTTPDASVNWVDACGHSRPDAFADTVVSFAPGANAGFGAKNMPCVALGPPDGAGMAGGSTDVVSLGNAGTIVVEFEDVELVDGPGPDLLVFENAFPGWAEPGFVAVSADGVTWSEWPCEPENAHGGYPHCAGVASVLANPMNGIDATDPATAGGDAFDLADLGVTSAKFVRIRDGGFSKYSGVSGGFDLDAVAAVHSTEITGRHD
jgi:hypothetical protein